MITLYGSAISPWYNKVKLALLEKGVNFEEKLQRPSQDEAVLAASPMGKIPYVDINGFQLAESSAIVEWLEDAYPTVSLLPPTTNGRGRARELDALISHYLLTPGAPLYGHLLFGTPLDDDARERAVALLQRGVAALARRADARGPWLCGEDYSVADVALAVALPQLSWVAERLLPQSPLAALPGLDALQQRLARRASVQQVWQAHERARTAFLAR